MGDIPQWSFLSVVGEWLSYQDVFNFVVDYSNLQKYPIKKKRGSQTSPH
jgi:hypothetical protein